MLKLPLAHALSAQSAIFLAAALVLPGVPSFAPTLAHFGLQRFAKLAESTLGSLTRRCSGSASPPTELER